LFIVVADATPRVGVVKVGDVRVLLTKVWASVTKANVSDTEAKSGIVNVVGFTVCDVRAIVTSLPLVKSSGEAAEVASEVAEATPIVGVVRVGLVRVLLVRVWTVVLSTVIEVSIAIEVPVIVIPLPPVNEPCPAT
jgi:hypothetical protein